MPNALVPELAVRDWQTSLRFYRDILGFAVVYARPEEGFAFLSLGEAELMIDQLGQGRDLDAGCGALVHPFGRGLNLQIRVPSLAPVLAALLTEAVSLHTAVEERWYRRDDCEVGHRQFAVADPDGYLLRFYEALGQRSAPPGA